MPTPDPASTVTDGRAHTPDSTAADDRSPGTAPAGVVQVPGYEVRGEIGRGNMGRVLAAHDLAFNREVAIKVVLHKESADAARTAGRFVRESRITGRLTHPGIPPAYQLGTLADGSPFLAMKLVRGDNLAALLAGRTDPAHDLPRFVGIFERIAQAVGYAHSQGVIHRDLKPANVMVGAFGEVQVMDWGLARDTRADDPEPAGVGGEATVAAGTAAGPTVADDRTQAGAVMGTPAYMAPEQARGEMADARADVFALGGLLTSILVGRAPFWSGDVNSTLVLAANGDTSEVLAALDRCPADAELVGIARGCLAPTRGARPADGTAVSGLVAEYRVAVETRLREADAAKAKARVRFVLAAAVVLLVAGAGGVAVWRVDEDGTKRAEVARLGGEERERKSRAADAVAALLDQAKTGLEVGDADRAAPFLDQADRRAADEAIADHAARLAAYRADLAMLRKIDEVDVYRWTLLDAKVAPPDKVVGRWAAAFAGYGITPGTTPPAAATRVAASPIKPALLAALHGWLALSPGDRGVPVRAVLDAADPDPFPVEVRRALAAGDRDTMAKLVTRPEWPSQPSWLIEAFAASESITNEAGRTLLLQAAKTRRNDFGLLMRIAMSYPSDAPEWAGERARWLQAAVALRPGNAVALLNLGDVLRVRKDWDGATAAFEDAKRSAPSSPFPYLALGIVMAHREDWSGAEGAFGEARRLDPNSPFTFAAQRLARDGKVKALLEKRDWDSAITFSQKAVLLDPENAFLHATLGLALAAKGNWDEAIRSNREAIRLDPKFGTPHAFLGDALAAKGDRMGAIAAYRDAIRLDPKYEYAHTQLGNALFTQGNHAEAIVAYRSALRLDPKSAQTHLNLGLSLRSSGDLPGAAAVFREAVRLAPTSPWGHGNLGWVQHLMGDHVGAVASYTEVVRLAPTSAKFRTEFGMILLGRGDFARAAAEYHEAIRHDSRYAFAHAGLGDVFRKQGRHADAIAAYRAALAIQPAIGYARDGLAYCERVLRGEVPTAPPPRAVGR